MLILISDAFDPSLEKRLALYGDVTTDKERVDEADIVLAALSCNSNQDRGMRETYVRNVLAQDPDLVFFAGDQSYDHKQHTAAWLKFGLQFRETFRDRPAIW